MKRNKWIAILLTMAVWIGMLPMCVSAEETMELQGVSEVKYSDSLITKFHLQKADFTLDGKMTNDDYAKISIGANATERRSESNAELKWKNSKYPLGYSYYRSSKSGNDDAAWYIWARWKMNGDEKALFKKLLNVAGNIQVGGRYQGHIDTQSGTLKGKAYFGIEQNQINGDGSATVLKYNEHKMSGDEEKDKLIQFSLAFADVNTSTNAIYLVMGGTEGKWLFWDDKNFAEVYYPQAFFRDVKAPTVQKITVQGGKMNTSSGTRNFANGDKVKIMMELSEPIRVKDGNYNNAFVITAPGLSDFRAITYDEVNYDKAQLTYEATVVDSPACRSFADFVVSVKVVGDKVYDLAGNVMKDSPSNVKDSTIRMDGYLPRIDGIDLVSVNVKKDDGTFETNKEQKAIIKPGDSLKFKVHFNQMMQELSASKSTFPVQVGEEILWASMSDVYQEGVKVTKSKNDIDDSLQFDAVEYEFTVPESAEQGVVVTIPAKKTDGYWELTELGNALSGTVGNLKLDVNRKKLQKRTEIKAQSSENAIFALTVDGQAPVITLTDNKGNPAPMVFDTAAEAAEVGTEKSNRFKLYMKADKTVAGSVKAELKYVLKSAPVSPVTIETKMVGAYTGTHLLEDMFAEFTIPDSLEMDATTHDIYIETTARDDLYNSRTQKFYLAADTVSPKSTITNGNGRGELVTAGDIRYWEYRFDVEEAASLQGTRLYYSIDGGAYQYTDSSSGFTVKTKDISTEEEHSGTVSFYAQDGSGNRESVKTANYYISSKRKVTPLDEASVGAYLLPRDIYFTGFLPSSMETTGAVYDYLVYSVNNGPLRAVRSENGEDVSIPEAELSNDCVISYKLLRNTEADLNVEEAGEVFHIVYHCDDAPPEIVSEVFRDGSGNAVSVRVASPGDASAHPKNITAASLVLSDGVTEMELETENRIINGIFYTHVDLTKIVSDPANGFISGRYTLTATVTDANGHVATEEILGADGMDVIVDAPVMRNIRVRSAHDPAFDESYGSFATGETAEEPVVITKESVAALEASGMPYTKKADAYRVEAQLYMKYSGTQYPKAEDADVWYAISEDYGKTWTEYAKAEVKSTDAQSVEEDGVPYAVYTAGVVLPKHQEDGAKEYYIRFRCGGNAYAGDILTVETKTDTTAPEHKFIVDAVGSDATGWSKDVHYTKEHVRYVYVGMDAGFMGAQTNHEVLKITDKGGNVVPESEYDAYIEIQTSRDHMKYVIFKQRCHLYVRISDCWGNSMNSDYECMYIDDLLPEHRVSSADNGEYTYMAVANVAKVTVGAVAPGSLTMTEEAVSACKNLVQDGVLEEVFYGDRPAQIDGKIISVYRFRQTKLSDQDYDIIGASYETDGSLIETFHILSVVSQKEPITKLSESHTASGLGKTIRAVETMTFREPVAQVTGAGAALLEEHGLEMAENLYTGEMMFSKELHAVLDIHTGGTVYVMDRLGRAAKLTVDVSGTEFVEYTGHTISYEEINSVGSIRRENSFIYSDNSAVRITVSGGENIAAMQAEVASPYVVSASSVADTTGTEYEGYYQNLVIEAPVGFADREGTMIAAQLKVKNKTNLEEYHDVILLRCDDKAPVLVDAAQMKRTDPYSPVSVIYLFHDRYGVSSVEKRLADDTFETTASLNGVAVVHYLENGRAILRATDNNGNVLQTDGVDIDGIVVSNNLVEGRDYTLEVLDPDKNPVEEGKFYQAVYVKVVPVEGGKAFTSTATNGIYTDNEEDIILELVDEFGKKILRRFTPPVDRTAPKVFALQDNSGDYVTMLTYSISVSDLKAGVEQVYAKGVGENGADVVLEVVDQDSVYKHYIYQTDSAEDVTIVAVDGAGNQTEKVLSSNSQIVGPLQVQVRQSIVGATNRNVVMTLYAEDGRRIYTHVPEDQGDSYLLPGEYLVSGNDIIFTKNGSVGVQCTDEAGNIETRILTVTNIDKSVPVVTPVIGELQDENGEIRTDAVSVRFVPQPEDDRYMEIYLLHVERKPDEDNTIDVAKLKERWKEYQKDPENFVMTGEFSEVFEALYQLDIKEENTYATITENGIHTFYLVDRAGNLAAVPVTVTTIDETAPAIQKVEYRFSAAPKLQQAETVSGEADLTTPVVEISKETTGYLTNHNVDITITAEEPIRFYGSDDAYSSSITKAFLKNGVYEFAVEDKAGNVAERTIAVQNIVNRELLIRFDAGEIVIFKGQENTFDKSVLEQYSVYTYDETGAEQVLSQEEIRCEIDYGSLNIEDLSQNTFNRNNPYTITYRAADEAGNRVERTRRVVLADVTDTLVTVNGEIPNGASCVYVDKGTITVDVANYNDMHAVVKVAPGQKNGAQMKFATGELTRNEAGTYTFTAEEGWYTVGVRTLFQDIFVVWVYVG